MSSKMAEADYGPLKLGSENFIKTDETVLQDIGLVS